MSGVVDLIVETLCSELVTIAIASTECHSLLVRDRFMKLTSSHIAYVLDCMRKNTTSVRNIRKYLLAALFNAPTTIASYYVSQVNHDLYGDER